MAKFLFSLAAVLLALSYGYGYSQGIKPAAKHRLRFGLTAVALEYDLATHKKLVNLLEKSLGIPIDTVYRKSYQEMSSLLESESVDVAFVCGLPYTLDHDKFGLELLVTPVLNNRPMYQSFLIVSRESGYASLEDLRGKVFAFSDPLSNSGFLVPVYYLSRMKETPETFFRTFFFSYSHANSIEAVASHLADGAYVDSYVWETVSKMHPKITAETKIIHKSDYMPFTPFVVRPGLDNSIKSRLKEFFLALHNDPAGREVLKLMAIEKFAQMKDSDYDSIRKMRKTVSYTKAPAR